uniref:Uncharacterized protein n=1 Tax=Anguilla anguilla TaxID=7936 RepID=A0A0E9WM63_ANGAN
MFSLQLMVSAGYIYLLMGKTEKHAPCLKLFNIQLLSLLLCVLLLWVAIPYFVPCL